MQQHDSESALSDKCGRVNVLGATVLWLRWCGVSVSVLSQNRTVKPQRKPQQPTQAGLQAGARQVLLSLPVLCSLSLSLSLSLFFLFGSSICAGKVGDNYYKTARCSLHDDDDDNNDLAVSCWYLL